MIVIRRYRLPAIVLSALLCSAVHAHHSGSMFYDRDEQISITGTVMRFSFRNPHAIVELSVEDEHGDTRRWTAETASPSGLRRRGWSQESLTVGETVTLNGIRARDGSLLMRITQVFREDGSQVGVPAGIDN